MKPERRPPARAVITGGAGFLGSHLCERLLGEGWAVECVDNLSTGRRENVASFEGHPTFDLRTADVAREALRDPSAGERVDLVFHLACPASPVQYRRLALETLEVSAVGTANALALAREQGAVLVLASTSEVYGDPDVHPQPETYWGRVDPVGPRSMYDEGKRYAEALATWHRHVHGTDVRIVRIFNTYGPRMDLWDGRVIPTFVRQALAGEPLTLHGSGDQTRSFCYVSDLVDGFLRVGAAEPGEVNNSPVNLGNPVERTMAEIARLIVDLTGSSSPIENVIRPPGDPERRRPDITRARTVLGWEPTVGLEDGLAETIRWARSTRSAHVPGDPG
jgi:dTDP-glucose 4,6-dehydratase